MHPQLLAGLLLPLMSFLLSFLSGQAISLAPLQPSVSPQPAGKMIDVGGYRVHLYCSGTGSPTVVITGAGYSFDWGLVQPQVSRFTQVCTYDHSGTAWSDQGPQDNCSLRTSEIHAALKAARITGPYVLVGHSLGALVARFYANKFPEEVSAMVFVDHATPMMSHQTLPQRPGPLFGNPTTSAAQPHPSFGTEQPSSPVGESSFEKLPSADYRLHLWADSLPGHKAVMSRNNELVVECSSELETATNSQVHPLGSKPLIVLSTAMTTGLAEQLVLLSKDGRQEFVSDSGHFIMIDRPDAVVRAIREVIDAVRSGKPITADLP